uniref:Peptidase S1 domain-containing protein n=1 Tax=Amphilophus citrinellus TaxID=61819 RepID=A0A3Q0R865_AMPCI
STTWSVSLVCGQAPRNSRILEGTSVVTAGLWPWMASLQKNGSHVCGGTLVAVDSVLSNANCFSNQSNGTNVAILHLSARPTLTDYIQPICLDNGRTFSEGSVCWSAGWSSGRGGGESAT